MIPHGKVTINTKKHHIEDSQEVSPSPAGDHKASMNRQDSMTDTMLLTAYHVRFQHHAMLKWQLRGLKGISVIRVL